MTIGVLHERGVSKRAIARQLGVDEKAVRYRLHRLASGAVDGRSAKPRSAEPWAEAIAHWMKSGEAGRGVNGLALYEWLVAEHGYTGGYKAIQRFVRARYPEPKLRVRRRIETPPGAQAQADWAEFPSLVVGKVERRILAHKTAVHGEFFRDIRPVNTIMQVSRFIDPEWLVEIEADAVVDEDVGAV